MGRGFDRGSLKQYLERGWTVEEGVGLDRTGGRRRRKVCHLCIWSVAGRPGERTPLACSSRRPPAAMPMHACNRHSPCMPATTTVACSYHRLWIHPDRRASRTAPRALCCSRSRRRRRGRRRVGVH
jgi:hypothetical protein